MEGNITKTIVGVDVRIQDVVSLSESEIQKCCRLCATPSEDTVHIFGAEGLEMKLADKIYTTLRIQVSETMKFHLQVCRKCIEDLLFVVRFTEKVKEAQEKIKVLQGFSVAKPSNSSRGRNAHPNSHGISKSSKTVYKIRRFLKYGVKKDNGVQTKPVNGTVGESSVVEQRPPKSVECVELSDSEHSCANDADGRQYSDDESQTNALRNERPDKNQLPLSVPSLSIDPSIPDMNTCKYCNASFKWTNELIFHQTRFHRDVVFSCPICFKIFYDDKEKFNDHEKTHGKPSGRTVGSEDADKIPFGVVDQGKFSSLFGKTPPNEETYKQLTFNKDSYKCKYCNLECTAMADLYTHQATFHPQFVFRCVVCSKVFYENEDEFRKHEDEHLSVCKKYELRKDYSVPQHLNKEAMYSHLTAKQKECMKIILGTKGGHSPSASSLLTGDHQYAICNESVGSPGTIKPGSLSLSFGSAEKRHCLKTKHTIVCKICQLEFKTRSERKIHSQFHHSLRLPCRFCPRTFRSKCYLIEHEDSHDHEVQPKYKCRKCGEEFENVDDYDKHRAYNHVIIPRFSCEICKRLYVRESELTKHIKKEHLKVRPFLCEKCGMCFESRGNLRLHVATHSKSQDSLKLHHCHLCEKTFKDKRNLKDHLCSHGGENSLISVGVQKRENLVKHSSLHSKDKFPCLLCGIVFNNRMNMLTHVKRHDEIRCLVCQEQFADVQLLLNHRKAMHPNEGLAEFSTLEGQGCIRITAAHKCKECSKYFASELSLAVHQREKHSPLKGPLQCDLCHTTYKEKAALVEHMAVQHPGKPLLQCSHCPSVFINLENKIQHEEGHTKKALLNPCQECGESFQTAIELSKHSVAMHAPSNGNSVVCGVCNKSFSCEKYLVAHQQKHLVKQNYSCHICLKSFNSLKDAKCHEKTHTEGDSKSEVSKNMSDVDALEFSLISSDHFQTESDNIGNVGHEIVICSNDDVMNCNYSEVVFIPQ